MRARMRRGENALAAFVELLRRNQRRYGGYVVHLAVVLMFVGFAGATFNLEETKLLTPGESWSLAGYTARVPAGAPGRPPALRGRGRAARAVPRTASPSGCCCPRSACTSSRSSRPRSRRSRSGLREDFYVILAGLEPDQRAALKVYINPLVNWIWIGGFVFVVGNTLLLWPMGARARTARERAP